MKSSPFKPCFIPKNKRVELKQEENTFYEMQKQIKCQENIQKLNEYIKKGKIELQEKKEETQKKQNSNDKDLNRKRSRSKEKNLEESSNFNNQEKSNYLTENEKKQLKDAYIRGKKDKEKKIPKPSEKFRNIFNFSWDNSDDTSRDPNPFYDQRHEITPLFGRGIMGGMDSGEKLNPIISKRKTTRFSLSEKKEAYNLDKPFSEMTEREWKIFRENNCINVKGSRILSPIRKWEEAKLNPEILESLIKLKFKAPMLIQMQVIPFGLDKRDILAIAPTGCGKTLAYLIPLVQFILFKMKTKVRDPKNYLSNDLPFSLILVPTRELAIQIDEELNKIGKILGILTAVVVGGRNVEDQSFSLSKGVHTVIGTPGRIISCIEKKYTSLEECEYVIIDEADKMIDLGFEESLKTILNLIKGILPEPQKNGNENENEEQRKINMPEEKSNSEVPQITNNPNIVMQLYTATMPITLESMARKYLTDPVVVTIGNINSGNCDIEQEIELLSQGDKMSKLCRLVEENNPPILVFVNRKADADSLSRQIQQQTSIRSTSLHSSKTQEKREKALEMIKTGKANILVCTSLASRGLDIYNVNLVINYDCPTSIEDYTHRIGRTGRAGKRGKAVTLLTEEDKNFFYDLRKYLMSTNQHVPEEIENHPASHTKAEAQGLAL